MSNCSVLSQTGRNSQLDFASTHSAAEKQPFNYYYYCWTTLNIWKMFVGLFLQQQVIDQPKSCNKHVTAQRWWSSTRLSLRCLAFTWVIWPLEKSNTSSLSSLRMIMLFWQRLSLVRLAPTMSLMKVGQCLGHSCFRIWEQSNVTTLFFHFKIQRAFSSYLYEDHVEFGNINTLLLWWKVKEWCQQDEKCHHKVLFTKSR